MARLCPPVSMRVLSTDQAIPADISIDRDSLDTAAASLSRCLPPLVFFLFSLRSCPYLLLVTSPSCPERHVFSREQLRHGRRAPDPTDQSWL